MNYTNSSSMKKYEDMYDAMPPFPSASVPLTGGDVSGKGKTTGRKIAPKQKVKTGTYKKSYGKGHQSKKKKVMSMDDLYAARDKRKKKKMMKG